MSAKQISHDRYHEIRAKAHECWPAVFTARKEAPLPLAMGAGRQVISDPRMEGFSRNEVRTFLKIWTNRDCYLTAVSTDGQRFNLDGSPAEGATEQQKTYSQGRLADRVRWRQQFKQAKKTARARKQEKMATEVTHAA